MQAPGFPFVHDLVLAGGGHTHALLLRRWIMAPQPGTRLTLVTPSPTMVYSAMLPGFIAGHYRREEITIDLVRLATRAGARLVLDRATGIDRNRRHLHLADRPPLAYDTLSLNIGAEADLPELPGFAAHGLAIKPMDDVARRWEAALAAAPANPHVAILGAGAGGCELALAIAHRLGRQGAVSLVDPAAGIAQSLAPGLRATLAEALAAAGVTVLTGETARELRPGQVLTKSGRSIAADLVLSAAGARPPAWLAGTGLSGPDGFLSVDARLATRDPAIFAAGDCATLTGAPRPKAGVFAVRAAPVLDRNLRAAAAGLPLPATFRPQADYLKLLSLGDRRAVGEKWGRTARGAAFWRLKDRIDRRFMHRLSHLPAMPRPDVPAGAALGLADRLEARPLCGGCGAKLGPDLLAGVLAALPQPRRADVRSGPGDDAAVIDDGAALPPRVMTTDHLRAFLADARLMAELTAQHALGDIWAMGAVAEHALAQIILPPLSPALQARDLAEATDALAATLRAAGADLVGGHSTEGAEATFGLTLIGRTARPVAKAGARDGDALILTKALGTGTILAAVMAAHRPATSLLGETFAAALRSMRRPMDEDARLLAPVAQAMTDVTGFGLAGHLAEMLDRAHAPLDARLDRAALPILPGALTLAGEGQGSSLAPANLAALAGRLDAPPGAVRDLLVDPQTCGGVLAAVPAAAAPDLIAALAAAGASDAAQIGTLVAGSGRIRLER